MPVSRFWMLTVATVFTAAIAAAGSAHAKKYCQADRHMHYGSGNGANKQKARRAAIQAWANFTVFEYGSAYGKWSLARFKRVSCSRSGAQWSCSVEANPCRRGR